MVLGEEAPEHEANNKDAQSRPRLSSTNYQERVRKYCNVYTKYDK